ncbi:hypothetical protein CFP56_022539, partial [Quercus suber]
NIWKHRNKVVFDNVPLNLNLHRACLNEARDSIPWNFIFPLAVWNIWKHRNKVVFDNVPLNLNLHRACLNEAREYFYCIAKTGRKKRLIFIPVKWNKPPE